MENVRLPGIEPGLEAWEAPVIAAGPQPHVWKSVNFAVILGQAIYHLWFMDGKRIGYLPRPSKNRW